MKRNILASIVMVMLLIIGAVVIRSKKTAVNGDNELKSISSETLKSADGKSGRDCWLAVDGVVYEIEQGYKWVEGEHTESSTAYCGFDMSAVIDQAPHGRTKLSQLKIVGTLED